jgi:hypothetical protein
MALADFRARRRANREMSTDDWVRFAAYPARRPGIVGVGPPRERPPTFSWRPTARFGASR